MKKKITSLTAGAAIIGSIGSFSVSADPGKTTNKSEKTKSDLTDFLSKDRKITPLPEEKNEQKKEKTTVMGLYNPNEKSKYNWNLAEKYRNAKDITNEKREDIEEKDNETQESSAKFEEKKPDLNEERAEADNTKAKENKSGRFYKFMSAAAGVGMGVLNKLDYAVEKVTCGYVSLTGIAKGILKIADPIATTLTGGKTTSEKIGGMAGFVGGQYISSAVCAAVGVSMCGAFPLVSSIVTDIAWSEVPKKYISIPLCVAILAGTAYFTGIPAVASTLAYSLITKYAFKGGIYVGKKIGGFFGNLF